MLTTDQHQLLVDAVDAAEPDARFPTEALALARTAGLLAAPLTDGLDTNPRDLRAKVAAIYDAGRVSASLGTIVSMHLQQVHAIDLHANDTLKALLRDGLAAGENYIGSITTERSSGGDLRSSTSTIERHEDNIILDRDAPIVTGGQVCDSFLVKVSEPDDGRTSLVYVPRNEARIDVTESVWDPMGMRESASVALRLRATVPGWHLVGAPGQFDRIVSDGFGIFAHIGWAAAWLGAATEAGNRLTQSFKDNPSLRRKILDNDVMLTRLATARRSLDTVRHALDALVADYAAGTTAGSALAIRTNDLKVLASRECFTAVDTLLEVGGLTLGYMRNPTTRIERTFRDLRSASLNFSTDKLATANGKLVVRAGFGAGPSARAAA